MSLFPDALPAPMAGADVAYTPDRVARALVEVLRPELTGRVVYEPYGGGGAFCDALGPIVDALLVTDCDPAAESLIRTQAGVTFAAVHDVSRGLPISWPRPQWIVTNPPFSLLYGDEAGLVKGTVNPCHLRVLFDTATEGVALLVVGQSLACGARDWLWDVAVPDEMLWIRERIAFQGPGRDGGKTDMREYAWVIWRKRAGSWMGRGLVGRVSTETGKVWRGVSNG